MSVDVPPGQVQGIYQWCGAPTWNAFRGLRIDNRTGDRLVFSARQDPDGSINLQVEPGWTQGAADSAPAQALLPFTVDDALGIVRESGSGAALSPGLRRALEIILTKARARAD